MLAMWGEPLPVAGFLDDNLEAVVSRPAQGSIAEDGFVDKAEPFLHSPADGDDEPGDPMASDYELVEVLALQACTVVKTQSIRDQQVQREERAKG